MDLWKDSRFASRPEGLDPARYYELSPEQRRLQEERTAIRSRLKRQYLLQLNDPNRRGLVPDPAVERWMVSKNYNIYPNHRGTPKVYLLGILCTSVPLLFLYSVISWDRARKERMIREGKAGTRFSLSN
ncbi:NADH dehydrogenase [ubiquinone] 1 beta subcomplex subunit 4 [Mantella aurantiaca]